MSQPSIIAITENAAADEREAKNYRKFVADSLVEFERNELRLQLEAERAKVAELQQKADRYWEDRERIKQLRAGERQQLKDLKNTLAALQGKL